MPPLENITRAKPCSHEDDLGYKEPSFSRMPVAFSFIKLINGSRSSLLALLALIHFLHNSHHFYKRTLARTFQLA